MYVTLFKPCYRHSVKWYRKIVRDLKGDSHGQVWVSLIVFTWKQQEKSQKTCLTSRLVVPGHKPGALPNQFEVLSLASCRHLMCYKFSLYLLELRYLHHCTMQDENMSATAFNKQKRWQTEIGIGCLVAMLSFPHKNSTVVQLSVPQNKFPIKSYAYSCSFTVTVGSFTDHCCSEVT